MLPNVKRSPSPTMKFRFFLTVLEILRHGKNERNLSLLLAFALPRMKTSWGVLLFLSHCGEYHWLSLTGILVPHMGHMFHVGVRRNGKCNIT